VKELKVSQKNWRECCAPRGGWNPVKELKAVFVTEDQFGTMVPVESGGGTESQLTAMV